MPFSTRSVQGSGSSGTLTTTYSEGTALGSTHGHIAWVRRLTATQPATPSGWTFVGGSSSSSLGLWLYIKRGDGTANSIAVATGSVSTVVRLSAYTVYDDDFVDAVFATSAGATVTSLASGTLNGIENDQTAEAYAALSSTAGGSGFSLSGYTLLAGGTSGSSIGYGELGDVDTGENAGTTATWTTSRNAVVGVAIIRRVAPAVPNDGTGSGATAWTGTATGSRTSAGTGAGSTAWTGAASGARDSEGAGSGSVAWVGAATGARASTGTAAGSTSWTGAATGEHVAQGTGSGLVVWTGTATGEAPAAGVNDGTGTGTTHWTGTAVGHITTIGVGAGTTAWLGTAQGATVASGTGAGVTTWTGIAIGIVTRDHVRAPAERTHTVTAEPRVYAVTAETRTLTIPAETRTVTA